MMFMNYLTEGNLTKRYAIKNLNTKKLIKLARKKFKQAVTKNQIIGEFEDDTWIFLTQGRNKRYVKFHAHEDEIRKNMTEKEYERFILNLKTLAMLRFGSSAQTAISEMVRYILEERALSSFLPGNSRPRPSRHGVDLYYLIEFLRVTEWGNSEYITECKDVLNGIYSENAENRKDRNHPCTMNEFESYFEFDFLIRDAWNNVMTPLQRKYYFPFYLHWTLTTILPQRVMEFCVMPYDCITEHEGRYFIDIRRTRLKGSTSDDLTIHYYTIEDDYYREEYEIPKWMYDLIAEWREDTKDFAHPFDLLFSVEYTANLKYKRMHIRSEENVFDAKRLGNMMKQFYQEFVFDYYGKILVTEEDLLKRSKGKDGSYQMYPGEIMMMQLKHTRHLAMINLIRWGCNPMIIKNFAGHTSTECDANYYNNVGGFMRSAIKMLWEKTRIAADSHVERDVQKEKSNMYQLIDKTKKYTEVDKGRCYSEYFATGDYCECFCHNGDCEICDSLWPNETEEVTKEEEEELNEEAAYIVEALKNNKFEGRIEECNEQVLRLQADSRNLATRLWKERMMREEKEPEYI